MPYRNRSINQQRTLRAHAEARAAKRKAQLYFGVGALVLVGFGALAMIFPPIDVSEVTGCPVRRVQPREHTIILLDETDRLSADDIAYASSVIGTEYLALQPGGRLTVRDITPEPTPNADIVICRVPERSSDGETLSNNRQIRRTFERIAGARLDALMQHLAEAPEQDTSPIREFISAAVDRADFSPSIGRRRLVVISDLAQHSGLESDYDGSFGMSDTTFDQLRVDMSGIALRFHYIRRASLSRIQGDRHRRAWVESYENMGADDIAIGHDPNIGETQPREIWIHVPAQQ